MSSCRDAESNSQPQVPESNANREQSKELKNITSEHHFLKNRNLSFMPKNEFSPSKGRNTV